MSERKRAPTLPWAGPAIPNLPKQTAPTVLAELVPQQFKRGAIILDQGPITVCFRIISGIVVEQSFNEEKKSWEMRRSLDLGRLIGTEFLCAPKTLHGFFRYVAATDVEALRFDNNTMMRHVAGKDLGHNSQLMRELIERQRNLYESLAREAVNALHDQNAAEEICKRAEKQLAESEYENGLYRTVIEQNHLRMEALTTKAATGKALVRRLYDELIVMREKLSAKDDELIAAKARIKVLEDTPSSPAPLNTLPSDAIGLILDGINELGTRITTVDQKVSQIQQGARTISEQLRLGTRFVADLVSFLAATPRESHTQLLLPATRLLLESNIPAAQQVGVALEGLLLDSSRSKTPPKKPS